MQLHHFLLPIGLLFLTACGDSNSTTASSSTDMASTSAPATTDPHAGHNHGADHNAADWTELFNGEDFTGWHTYGKPGEMGSAWKVADGAMYLDVSDKDGWQTNNGGDIITDQAYENYELELEWKIGECGNSGIIYNVQETDEYQYPWQTGPEMQILDNTCHPDAKIKTHRAGDLYDMVSVANENVKPAGEWNLAKLVVTPGKVEHWLNGEKQVQYYNDGDEWKAMIAGSKFKDMKNWGIFSGGKISLQDHGDPVWFRNIRVREL